MSKMLKTLEDVLAAIEDSLPETMLIEPEIKCIKRPTLHMKQGYYIQYSIGKFDCIRAYYLGNEAKQIERAFNLWVTRWMV